MIFCCLNLTSAMNLPSHHFDCIRTFDEHGTFYEFISKDNVSTPVVVLVHGVGLDHHLWDYQVPSLIQEYSVLRYDILGHGKTRSHPKTKSLDAYVRQLTDLLSELQISTIHLVGYSVGGLIAQRFAITQHSRLKTVSFLNSVYKRREKELTAVRKRLVLTATHGADSTVEAAIARWFTPLFASRNPILMNRIRGRLLTTNLEGYVAAYRCFVEGDTEIGNELQYVTCPALAITGALDVGSTPDMCYRMAKDMPRAKVCVIPNVAHGAPQETPTVVSDALISFLKVNGAE